MSVLATPSAWQAVLQRIAQRVSPQQFSTWFQNLKASSDESGRLRIRVPNHFFKEWLAENYITIIKESVRTATRQSPEILFVVDENLRPSAAPYPSLAESLPAPTPSTIGVPLNEHYTFDTFVVGPSNQLAHAAAMAVSDSPGRTYNPLFTYGSVGLGKSHLLQAICHALLQKNRYYKVAYLSCETFVNEFISAIQRNDLLAFRNRYRKLDLLVIDDIQFLSRAERSQEEFFHTFNDLYNAQKQIVMTSDQPPSEISGLRERLTSRFKSGLVARIDHPSYETRVAILRKKASLRQMKVPDDVIDYVATVITNNIRELSGAVTKIIGYASLLRQPITMEVARSALHEPAAAKGPVTIENILSAVTRYFGVRVSDLQSKKRTRSIVLPRQICMYLARSLTPLSLEEIGGFFGGRDHSTVLHADDKIRLEVAENGGTANTIQKLLRELSVPSAQRPTESRG